MVYGTYDGTLIKGPYQECKKEKDANASSSHQQRSQSQQQQQQQQQQQPKDKDNKYGAWGPVYKDKQNFMFFMPKILQSNSRKELATLASLHDDSQESENSRELRVMVVDESVNFLQCRNDFALAKFKLPILKNLFEQEVSKFKY